MFCSKCGKEIDENSSFCKYCGFNVAKVNKPSKGRLGLFAGIIVTSFVVFGLTVSYPHVQNYIKENIAEHKRLNPVLNSPADITDEVIDGIINNSIESLTINYNLKGSEYCSLWEEKCEAENNSPFTKANSKNPLEEIRFKIIFGDKVTSTEFMFYGLEKLTLIPLFDTQNVTNMRSMFRGATSLTTVPLFDTQNVTDMTGMFSQATSLTSIPLFDTQNVTNMSRMFEKATALTTVPLFNTKNVSNMSHMFEGTTSLTTVPLFDTQNVTNISNMFYGATSLTTVPNFNTQNLKYMNGMFYNTRKLKDLPEFCNSSCSRHPIRYKWW